MRGLNNSVETINAAATAIVAAERRVQQSSVQKRRWRIFWSLYWCFGSHRHGKRVGHAVLVPEPTEPGTAAPTTENPILPPTIVLPFIAPPPSPASFLQSEPPSAIQSPGLSFSSFSANIYSPSGPASIFAIGPYTYETQLVSPPVFSSVNTEPSTAPFTPPPESVHLTTPSSPEVPFAHLLTSSLDPNHRTGEACQRFPLSNYEFQLYQLYPGSPVSHLKSPSSVISGSGTSSPYPDREFISRGRPFLNFGTVEPPNFLSMDGLSTSKWGPRRGSGSLTPEAAGLTSRDSFLLESQMSDVTCQSNSDNGSQCDNIVMDHRVSFELTAEDVEVGGCVEVLSASIEPVTESLPDVAAAAAATTERDMISNETRNAFECCVVKTSNDISNRASRDKEEQWQQQIHPSLMHGSVKEFKFDNTEGGASDKPTIGSNWWANEKVVGKESGSGNNWAFFPMIQPGVS